MKLRGAPFKRRSVFRPAQATSILIVLLGAVVLGQTPPVRTDRRNRPELPENILQHIRRTPPPKPVKPQRGALSTYTLKADGTRQLASNIGLLPTPPGQHPRSIPVQLDANRRAPLSVGGVKLPGSAALVTGIFPAETVPTGKIYVYGDFYDDTVSMTVAAVTWVRERRDKRDLRGNSLNRLYRLVANPQGLKTHRGEFGDYVEWTVPSDMAPGQCMVSIENSNAPGSNPGYFNVKAPYPTEPFVVAVVDYLNLPTDYDSPAPGELTFSFGAGTQRPGGQLEQQIINFGENGDNGFLVSERLELMPEHIKVPFFALPRERMGDELVIEFVGRELDESSSDAWGIAGGIIGAGIGAYFSGPAGLAGGWNLGTELASDAANKLGSGEDDSLGVHTNKFVREEEDFGAIYPGYPSDQNFDNNTNSEGKNAKIAYVVRNVDAPLVRRVTVRINSVDTSKVKTTCAGIPVKPSFYVLARAFDRAIGANFPASKKMKLTPSDKVSNTAKLDDPVFFVNTNEHHMPFVYVELSLWWAGPTGQTAFGQPTPCLGQINRQVGRTFTRLFMPVELIKPGERQVVFTNTEQVEGPAGAGFGGTFAVNYTITVDRSTRDEAAKENGCAEEANTKAAPISKKRQ